MICADCGKTIEFDKVVKHWGQRKGKGWEFCCRIVMDPERPTRMLSADYHHIEGEEQRNFRAP